VVSKIPLSRRGRHEKPKPNEIINLENDIQSEESLLIDFAQLWDQADKIWEREDGSPEFAAYVSADYMAVYEQLKLLRGHVETFLEWGSGLGVVTIMASRMGFEASGIEAESKLVDYSNDLADEFDCTAQFAHGSFIPDDFIWDPSQGDESERTAIDLPEGYEQLDSGLEDMDLIYAYPWPTEHRLYHNILNEFGAPNVQLLTYDAREGINLTRLNVR